MVRLWKREILRVALCLLCASLAAGCTGETPARAGGGDASPDPADAATPVSTPLGRGGLPPPISGGTLIITRDGARAIAADPDSDRLFIVGLASEVPGCDACDAEPKVLATVEFPAGEEPGRLAEDGVGRVHVVLRRGAAVATVDLASGELLARRPVCAAPRGIAYDPDADRLVVACASGEMVWLPALGGEVERSEMLAVDLRDVVVVPSGLVVSRFKSAELLRLDRSGTLIETLPLSGIERTAMDPVLLETDRLEPAVAWRTVATEAGSVHVLHQYGLAEPIDIGESGSATAPTLPYSASPGARCGGVVEQTVSVFGPDAAIDMGMPIPMLALSVDVAVSSDGAWLAVAHAGAPEDRVTIYRAADVASQGRSPVRCADQAGRVIVQGQPVAVAVLPGRIPAAIAGYDWLVVQSRSPARLSFYRAFTAPRITVVLDETATSDAGHDLYHFATAGGIACAQCHPEGAEDGRVWQLHPFGDRRTQAANVSLAGTEPFHWSGNLPTLGDLVDEVFVRRMGGSPPPSETLSRLESWLFALRPPPPRVAPDAPAAERGRALFESASVGCAECHAGPSVAKATNEDVGVASPEAFQIPSLRGVGYRAPFLHNGCASTLHDRFDPSCGGGELHGKTSHLRPDEIDDLVQYLESL